MRARRVTGQGSSPHPAVAFERRCAVAQGPQGGQLWGEAVPAAGRVQGAGLGAPHGRGEPLSGSRRFAAVAVAVGGGGVI